MTSSRGTARNCTLALSPDNTSFPPPTVFSGTKKTLLMIGRQWSNECKIVSSGLFGNATSMAKITNGYPLIHDPTYEICYLSGTINITAGIVKIPFSRFVSSRIIEARQDNLPIEPSIWTEEALFQMPDVTSRITNLNNSHVPTWDNLDDYVKTTIKISYMAAWDSFSNSYEQNNLVELKVNQRVDMLRASVSQSRVYGWLAINLLLTASGIILVVLQSKVCRPVINDGPVAALMTDTSDMKNVPPQFALMSIICDRL
jgi:hypothetical protein